MTANYYQILDLEETSSLEEIKKSYRKLAKVWHPDRNNNSPESVSKFKLISEPVDERIVFFVSAFFSEKKNKSIFFKVCRILTLLKLILKKMKIFRGLSNIYILKKI